jgi:sarcosine oxidase
VTDRYEIAVVGLGLFGSACLRYLARQGADVVGIGPPEPASWDERDTVFASHYDSGRITRRIDRSELWAELAVRSIDAYGPLEQETGIAFHHPVGTLWADVDRARVDEIADVARRLDVACEVGETEPEAPAYGFSLPPGLAYVYESAPAGYIDPRKLLEAQLTAAVNAGAVVVEEAAVARACDGAAHELRTADGGRIVAERVVIATGAYANAYGLVPEPLPMRIKAEVTILVPITAAQAEALAGLPTLIYGLSSSALFDFYLVPPARYPDGNLYLKAGAESDDDQVLTTREEMNDWMRSGDSQRYHADFCMLLGELLPTLPLDGSLTKRCLISYTAHGRPYIEELEDGLLVLLGGNGRGAKSSDAIGAAAARLTLDDWDDTLSREQFRVPADGEPVLDTTPM